MPFVGTESALSGVASPEVAYSRRGSKGPGKFLELQRMIEGISQRMLKTTLRNLERDGFATREIFPEVPPKVEYELTYLGLSLLEPMEHLVAWIGGHWSSITKARERFDLSQQARVREINRAER